MDVDVAGRRSLCGFKEAIARSSCHAFVIVPPLPLSPPFRQVVSQTYKAVRAVPYHEGVPHPVGTLFTVNKEYEILSSAGFDGGSVQEKTTEDGHHTVSACYAGRASATSVSVSASHMLGQKNCVKLHYTSDLRKDSCCSIFVCHYLNEGLLLSTSYLEGSSSDPIFEVEVLQERRRFKASGKLESHLANGSHWLDMVSYVRLPAELTLKSSIRTDLRGNGSSGLELVRVLDDANLSSRVRLGWDGNKELSLQAHQSLWETAHVELSGSTDLIAQHLLSLRAEHKVGKENKVSMKATSKQEVNLMASFGEQWKWNCSREAGGGHVLSMEWQHKGDSEDAYSLSLEARRNGLTVNGKVCLIL